MEKYPITFWVVVGVVAALIASIGSTAVDTMNAVFVQLKWCGQGDSICYLRHYALVTTIILLISFITDLLRSRSKGWDKIEFSAWYPVGSHDVIGGIKIQNNKDYDLEECTAELLFFNDDKNLGLGHPAFNWYMKDSALPDKLFWDVDGEFKINTLIGRGKEGYLAVAFPLNNDDQRVTGREYIYKVLTIKTNFTEPINSGYLDIRISAKMKGKSLAPIIKSLRIEVIKKTAFIREVIDANKKKKQ